MPIGRKLEQEIIDLNESSAFNQSGLTQRSPPTIEKMSTVSKQSVARQQMNALYYTKCTTVACNACEVMDTHSKLKCRKCGRWWHPGCQKGTSLFTATINEGTWTCLACVNPPVELSTSDSNADITRTEFSQTETFNSGLPTGSVPGQPDMSSTIQVRNQPPIKPSTSTQDEQLVETKKDTLVENVSRASSLRSRKSKVATTCKNSVVCVDGEEIANQLLLEKLALIEKQKEIKKRAIRLEADKKILEADIECHTEKELALSRASNKSSRSTRSESVDERRQSIEKCTEWVSAAKASEPQASTSKPAKANRRATHGDATLRFLNPDVTIEQFLDNTLNVKDDYVETKITKNQLRARGTLNKDLPEFSGNPKDWPYFISKLRESTQMCGYSEIENLDRLQKCLKGEALESVRCELMTTKSLPGVLSTLKLLYGRPTAIFNALIEEVRKAPPVKAEKLESLVVFAMKIKNLSETMIAADMETYLNNPSLLSEMVDKLPASFKMMWGDHITQSLTPNSEVTIDMFNAWLRARAESASAVFSVTSAAASSGNQPTTSKSKKNEKFQGVHHESIVPASTTSNSSNSNYKKWETKCPYCKEMGHLARNCKEFIELTTSKRWFIVKKYGLCVRCLGKHPLKHCGSDDVCSEQGCENLHHKLLHSAKGPETESQTVNANVEKPQEAGEKIDKLVGVHNLCQSTSFQVVPVCVTGKSGEELMTYAFLDNGSEISLIERALAKRLGCKGPKEALNLKWTGDVARCEEDSMKINITIGDTQKTGSFQLRNVRTVKSLDLPLQSISSDQINRYPHLKAIPIIDFENAKPQILLGLDNYQLMTPQEVVEGEWNEPVGMKTRLGWCIYGNPAASDNVGHRINVHVRESRDLHELVDKYFQIESIGIMSPKIQLDTLENMRAVKILEQTVRQLDNGSYEAGLLWKSDKLRPTESRNMAVKRWCSLERSMLKTPEVMKEMLSKLREYYSNKFLVDVSAENDDKGTCNSWYLPIFPVFNPNKPGKLRLVWDAAATVNNTSLNSNLLSGPDLNATLLEVLSKFRERKFAVGGDIEQMFHQVKIREEDQDYQRCIWRESPRHAFRTAKMVVMTFGATCSPCTAQYVKNLNANKYIEEYPRAVEAIVSRHYVDDYLDSFDDWQDARRVTKQVIEIHKRGGFNIRNFVACDSRIIKDLGVASSGCQEIAVGNDADETKVLGLWWDVKRDELKFKVNQERLGSSLIKRQKIPTKREVLRVLMMIFDPLGLLGYYIAKGKLVLKAVWRSPLDWDDEIQEPALTMWQAWISAILHLEDVKIPRWYFTNNEDGEHELHVFVDAGEEAMTAVAYIVKICGQTREVALVAAKNKVSPNKPVSIPRLELQAAVIGARLASTVRNNHSIKINRTLYWTDSRNVICWIRSPRRFKVYVAHRISEIRESTKVRDWRWVPTNMNPADTGTKWNLNELYTPEMWFTGPEYIQKTENWWPIEPKDVPPVNEEILELRCNVTMGLESDSLRPDISRFSSLTRLINTQAYVLKFFYQTHLRCTITQEERENAFIYLIRSIQQEYYENEFQQIKEDGHVSSTSKIRKYSPFIGEHRIIRMRSRLQKAKYLSFDQRCPIILPNDSLFTSLVIEHYHIKYLHMNHLTALNELRQKYVIPALRSKLKSIRARCMKCRIRNAQVEVPEMGELPYARMAANIRPFSYVGIDLFGPLLVKQKRHTEKRWGVIFTCLTIRAVHIEVVSSLSTDSFILSMRCFISRRGQPLECYSDNGTNFHGASNEFTKTEADNVTKGLKQHYSEIKWRFNPPHAPHMGGAWERLIRTIKSGLACLRSERAPSEEALRATLVEIEAVINARPLTYVDTDVNELEALTPNHFLLGSSSGYKPIGNFNDDPDILRIEWKRQQVVVNEFWKRWTNEYLPQISRRTKWYDPVEPLRVNDVVAIMNARIPNSWTLGRIQSVVTSKDGSVRQAEVRTANGVMKRPASKLAVLLREPVSSAGGGVMKVGADRNVADCTADEPMAISTASENKTENINFSIS